MWPTCLVEGHWEQASGTHGRCVSASWSGEALGELAAFAPKQCPGGAQEVLQDREPRVLWRASPEGMRTRCTVEWRGMAPVGAATLQHRGGTRPVQPGARGLSRLIIVCLTGAIPGA